MLMSTIEYNTLFGNKPKEEITDQDIIKKRRKHTQKLEASNNNFITWKEIGIITDEWGNSHAGVIEKTGFENEGF